MRCAVLVLCSSGGDPPYDGCLIKAHKEHGAGMGGPTALLHVPLSTCMLRCDTEK